MNKPLGDPVTSTSMQGNEFWTWVERQVACTIDCWNTGSGARVDLGLVYSPAEQEQRERAYDRALDEVETALRKLPKSNADRLSIQDNLTGVFGRFSANALGLDATATDLLIRDFLPVGTNFVRSAREFDPDLATPEIIQGCRNAWTACGMQPLLGVPIRLTPAIFGYSMLYPYSDNVLDRKDLASELKLKFNRRFRSRLAGDRTRPVQHRERAIWKLIQLVEEQYPRLAFPEIWLSLLAIHRAQEASIVQIGGGSDRSHDQLLQVSCTKGGTSVLADAYLAQPHLGEPEKQFAFAWGVLLQLGDDLQDIREDLVCHSITLFSQAAAAGKPLDDLALQLLRFSAHVIQRMNRLPAGSTVLKNLLAMSWRSLIIRAIADSHQYFSAPFVEALECYSPFRFGFLRTRQKRLESHQGLYATLFDAFAEGTAAAEGPAANVSSIA